MRLVTNGSPNAIRRLTFIAPVSAGTFSGRESESARAQLFEGLDGHTISSASGTWQVRVYSICEEPGAWWLQLSLDGSPEYTIAMRTPLHERAIDTLCRLSGWLAGAARTDEPSPSLNVHNRQEVRGVLAGDSRSAQESVTSPEPPGHTPGTGGVAS